MRLLAVVLLLNLSCATLPLVRQKVEYVPDPSLLNVIALVGAEGTLGHACPCGEEVWTAAHIAWDPKKEMWKTYSWEDGWGRTGSAIGVWKDSYRDLARLVLDKEPGYYIKAERAPARGSTVRWVQFADELERAVLPEEKEAKVLYYKAGYIFFDQGPKPGASGSCLFNDLGEVIGIVVWTIRQGFDGKGVAVSLVPYDPVEVQ